MGIRVILVGVLAIALSVSVVEAKSKRIRSTSTTAEPSIAVADADPTVGETITFLTTGGSVIQTRAYPEYGDAAVIPVDGSITLTLSGLHYAWLDDDEDLSNGFLAVTSFDVAE